MKFIGVDLHKQTISVCVVHQSRKVLERRSLQTGGTPNDAKFWVAPPD